MRLPLRRLGMTALALITCAVATASPAHAASASCSSLYRVGSYAVPVKCFTTPLWTEVVPDRFYVFAVRDDGRVMHIWQRYPNDPYWSGWVSLGGTAVNGVWLYPYDDSEYPNGPEITVAGTDNGYWCNERYTTHWTGWHRCYV